MDLLLDLPADVAAQVGVDLAPLEHSALVAVTAADPAPAEDDEEENEATLLGSLLGLAPLLLIGLVAYFMLIRPTRRRQREQVELSKSIDVGDEVVLTSGVVGFISAKDDDVYWVEIDDDVQIRVLPGAVSRKFAPTATAAAAPAGTTAATTTPAPLGKPGAKGRGKPVAAADADATTPDTDAPA